MQPCRCFLSAPVSTLVLYVPAFLLSRDPVLFSVVFPPRCFSSFHPRCLSLFFLFLSFLSLRKLPCHARRAAPLFSFAPFQRDLSVATSCIAEGPRLPLCTCFRGNGSDSRTRAAFPAHCGSDSEPGRRCGLSSLHLTGLHRRNRAGFSRVGQPAAVPSWWREAVPFRP